MTHSTIGYEQDGKVTAVYCHFDGKPRHHAPRLLEGFNSADEAIDLVSEGGMSSLGYDLDSTTFYVRDRGESMDRNAPITYDSRQEAYIAGSHFYLFSVERNCWLYSGDRGESWCRLDALELEKR